MSICKKHAAFFGSFNPVHYGHIEQINILYSRGYMIDVVISPHNPTKDFNELIPFDIRVDILEASIIDKFGDRNYQKKIHINTIENNLPKPNYTYKTLRMLTKQYGYKPALVIGADVINDLHNWKKFDEIKEYPIITLARPGYKIDNIFLSELNIIDTIYSEIHISSSDIRYDMSLGHINYVKNSMTESGFKVYNRYYNINKILKK